MNTKIFCDIAELKQIRKFNKKKIVKGFTTNPSLMKSAGAKDYKKYSKEILKICPNKPVSLEVFADDYTNMKLTMNYKLPMNNNINLYLKGDNLLDQEKRDHTSFLKDKTLMGSRSLMLGVTGDF